jgi:hypothetical protein
MAAGVRSEGLDNKDVGSGNTAGRANEGRHLPELSPAVNG